MKRMLTKSFKRLLVGCADDQRQKLQAILSDIKELIALQDIRSVVNNRYIPRTSSAISARDIRYILNDIVINGRKSIIEFGAGLSTVYIANLIKAHGISCKFVSVEDNEEWLEVLQNMLVSQQAIDFVEFVNAPLVEPRENGLRDTWYSVEVIQRSLSEAIQFDCIVIDGPPAYTRETALRRFGALSFIDKNMAEKAAIFIDDIDRPGEQQMIDILKGRNDLRYHILSEKMGLFLRGTYFNIT